MAIEEEVDLDEIGQIYKKVLWKTQFHIYRALDWKTWFGKLIKIIYILLCLIFPFIFLFLQFTSWLFIEDFQEKMQSIGQVFNISAIIIRVSSLVNKSEELESLFLDFEDFYCNQHRPKYAISELNKTYRQILKVDLCASIFFAINFANWFIFPVIFNKQMINFITGDKVDYVEWDSLLPTLIFIRFKIPWNEVRYMYEVVDASIANVMWEASNITYFAIFVLLKTQFSLLGESIIKNTKTNEEHEGMSFKYFVEDHNKLIKVCKTLERNLSLLLSALLGTAGMLMGSILLVIALRLNDKDVYLFDYLQFFSQFIGYLILSLSELYLFCWLSEIANTAFINIGEAIYESDWYLKLRPEEKNIILSLKISQKGVSIRALKLVKINLKTFMEVIRVSYSFFTILSRGMKKKSDDISIMF